MESTESAAIAAFVGYFNTASTAVLAVFAVFGAIAIFRRLLQRADAGGGKTAKRRKNGAKGGYTLLSAFCVAALAAFAAEATVFNFQHWLKPFAGPELELRSVSPENPNVILTSGGGQAELLSEKDEKTNTPNVGIVFKKLNLNVTSIFVDVGFGKAETREMTVSWTDEMSNSNSFKKKLLKNMPHDNYAPLQSCGKVSELKVMFTAQGTDNGTVEITQVALNKQIPFYFSGLRLIVVSFLFFALVCLLGKKPRDKAAYYLFEYKFNPGSRKQNAVYALFVVILILFSWACVYTSYTKAYMQYPTHQQYNKYLVDALMEGRTWLNYGDPTKLLKAERPYDNNYRIANGYRFDDAVMWDWAWYKGKFYCYFGVVPAVILYLPYKLVTGEYLSNNAGISVFTSVIIVLMALLWRFCAKRYMPISDFSEASDPKTAFPIIGVGQTRPPPSSYISVVLQS